MNKVQLQNWLEPKATTLLNKINITTYFENQTVKLHISYSLNTRQILCQSDIIYYIIYKFIFYA